MPRLGTYLQCSAYIFLLSFKPSEPHLSAYLEEVKHLTKHQRDAEVYTVFTYASLVVVSLVAALKLHTLHTPMKGISDKALILFGCAARLATRLLLLWGDSLLAMQLMQVAYSVGLLGEMAFYAYCLKVIPGHGPKLVAVVQGAYLVSHTATGFLGDWLLRYTDIGLMGLMWISFFAVLAAFLIALSFRSLKDESGPLVFSRKALLRAAYRSRSFWLSTAWWTLSYPSYMTIFGYESSLYADQDFVHDNNGAIFAVALLAGAGASLLLSWESVDLRAAARPLHSLLACSLMLVAAMAAMSWQGSSEWVLASSFTVFFIFWSFANALFYGETRRACDEGVQSLDCEESERVAAAERVVSVAFMVNSALGTLLNGLVSFITFTCLGWRVEGVYQLLTLCQAALTLVVLLLALCSTRPEDGDTSSDSSDTPLGRCTS
ncbi:unnamed protein product [Effrenium voratum]|uniref:Uncharacterized protein n=2 Tax=Effrenium voratum TaxID=2562239 RepID=A0AA36IHU1_9DINO|nr:unnamed protein product [Effrenium voratum]CAJ1424471.1 unnamed protein product [Effrenium voratum]